MSLPLNARDETKGLVGGDLADACLLAQLAGWLPGCLAAWLARWSRVQVAASTGCRVAFLQSIHLLTEDRLPLNLKRITARIEYSQQ